MLRFVEEHIDRLALAAANVSAVVQEVDPTRLSATVVFDGSTVGVPVKVLGHVWPMAGDRVLVSRVGPRRRRKSPDEAYAGEEWVVVGVSSRATGPNFAALNFPQTSGTNTSATIADLPSNPTMTFTKRLDTSPLLLFLSFTAYITVNNASMGAWLTFTQGSFFSQIKMVEIENGSVGARFGPATFRVAPDDLGTPDAPTLAAGTYEVKPQWARLTGAGTLNMTTGDDHGSMLVMELGT